LSRRNDRVLTTAPHRITPHRANQTPDAHSEKSSRARQPFGGPGPLGVVRVAGAHVAALLFGPGQQEQTTAESDGGNLISKTIAYRASGGVALR